MEPVPYLPVGFVPESYIRDFLRTFVVLKWEAIFATFFQEFYSN